MRLARIPLLVLALAGFATACSPLQPLTPSQALDRLTVATSKVYDSEGNLIANLHGEIDRDIATIEEVPKHVRDAVISIEDERFWRHQGLDLKSIVRAAATNVRTAGQSSRIQGGSTISQQLAKNLYFSRFAYEETESALPARTLSRKVAEARVTWQLERQYTKAEILEMYLNTIYLGRGVYGVATAARSYFGKQAHELTLSESAFLAGLIHEPGRYDWDPSDAAERRKERQDAARSRRNVVLDRMLELGFISEEQADEAKDEKLKVEPAGEQEWNHPYFVELVLRQLGVLRNSRSDKLDPRYDFLGTSFEERSKNVYRGGLRIYTTLDPQAQEGAESAIDTLLPKELERLSAALAAIEPSTGYIRALVGGRNYYPDCEDEGEEPESHLCRLAKVNLALGNYGGGSGRQPGSSFKPFVLAAALQRGIPLSRSYSSSPFSYSYLGGEWNVRNYEGSGGGAMNLLDGTAKSVNAVFAKLEIEGVGDGDGLAGAARVAGVARRMGIGFPTREELQYRCGDDYATTDVCLAADDTPSVALGAKEVSPLDMASAYATLANDGVRVEPTAIARIVDGQGRVLYEADPEQIRVLPSGVARGVTYALRQVVSRGTATRAALPRPAAAKTGTSQSWRDAWLAGYVPQLAGVVWVGNPIPLPGTGVESMTPANGYPYRIVGGTLPSMIWRDFMTHALDGVPVRSFPDPPIAVLRHDGAIPQPSPTPEPSPSATPDEDEEEEEADEDDEQQAMGRVPNVVGYSFGDASDRLRRAGYDVSRVRGCARRPTRLHQVYSQSPGGGDEARRGSTVTIHYQGGSCEY